MTSRCGTFLSNLVRLKAIPPEEQMMETNLRRSLGTLELVAIGVGNMVGSGLYVLTGVVAKNLTGPAIMISYLISGVVALLAALCFAEFSGSIPITGSAYTFTYMVMGEIWAYLIGWNLILEYLISIASVGKTMSSVVDDLANNAISNFTIEHIMGGHEWTSSALASYPDFLGVVLVTVISIFAMGGMSVSARTMAFFQFINICIVGIIVVAGLSRAEISNWQDYGGFAPYGISGMVAGSATLFFSYIGFDAIAMSNEETINPRKSIPVATWLAVAVAAFVYIMASAALTLVAPYTTIDVGSPFPHAFALRGDIWIRWVISVGAFCGMTTSILGPLFTMPRIMYAMARDGLLFPRLAVINETTKVPLFATIVSVIVCNIILLLFSIEQLVSFLSVGALSAYMFVAAAVILLRYQPVTLIQDSSGSELVPMSRDPNGETKDAPAEEVHIPGTLKRYYRNTPLIGSLAQFSPGRCVQASLIVSIAFQVGLLVLVENRGQSVVNGDWWAILLVCLLGIGAIVSFLVIPMHYQAKPSERYYSVKGTPFTPALSIFLNLILALKLQTAAWIRFIVWIVIGLVLYFGYGYWHSLEARRPESRHGLGRRGSQDSQAPIASYGSLKDQ